MAFTIGSSQLKKRFYNVYLDMISNDYISKLIDGTKIHKMLKDNIDNLNETHLTDGATINKESGLYVYTGINDITVTIPESNNQSGIMFITVPNRGGHVEISNNDFVIGSLRSLMLKDYSNNDDEALLCSLLPLGAVLEGLTMSDSKGDVKKLASSNTIVVSNNVSVNFTLAGLADELRKLIKTYKTMLACCLLTVLAIIIFT